MHHFSSWCDFHKRCTAICYFDEELLSLFLWLQLLAWIMKKGGCSWLSSSQFPLQVYVSRYNLSNEMQQFDFISRNRRRSRIISWRDWYRAWPWSPAQITTREEAVYDFREKMQGYCGCSISHHQFYLSRRSLCSSRHLSKIFSLSPQIDFDLFFVVFVDLVQIRMVYVVIRQPPWLVWSDEWVDCTR